MRPEQRSPQTIRRQGSAFTPEVTKTTQVIKPGEIDVFKLENFSLRKRMYIVGALGIIGLLGLAVLEWYMLTAGITPENQLYGVLVYVIVGSAVIMYLAHVIGRFGDRRATTLVEAIQNIKKGDLTHATLSGQQILPGFFRPGSQCGNHTHTCDNDSLFQGPLLITRI